MTSQLPEVLVLFNGFSRLDDDRKEMYANCTCTLIKSVCNNIIIDTMTMWDGGKIKKALQSNGLKLDQINWVVSTHGHSDHIGNNNLFQNAKQIVANSISRGETYYLHDFDKSDFIIDDNIRIISTPGHTLSCVSLVVETEKGVVVVVGDLFEKKEDIDDENIWIEAGSENRELQRKNRRKVIRIADYIIPGHGEMFRVTEKIKNQFLL